MKKLYSFLLILVAGVAFGQDPVSLIDEPGTWTYGYLNDANTKMYIQQFGMSPKDVTDFKNKMDQLVEVLHRNPVFANPTGFDAAVESRPYYPHDYKKQAEYYGYVGEMNFRLPMWFESKGRKYKQTIEPPRMTVYFNQISFLRHSAFTVSDLKTGNTGTNKANPAALLRDVCRPMKIKDLAPGVVLYDYAIVFTKPGQELFLPCTVNEAFSRMINYYEAAQKEEPYYEMILTAAKEEYARLSESQLNSPAYFGGMAGITSEKTDDPLMIFNTAFFDRNLPKSAVQAIVFPVDSDYFRTQSDFAPNSVGYKRINQLQHTLDYGAIEEIVD